jgi:hypothetical protein
MAYGTLVSWAHWIEGIKPSDASDWILLCSPASNPDDQTMIDAHPRRSGLEASGAGHTYCEVITECLLLYRDEKC